MKVRYYYMTEELYNLNIYDLVKMSNDDDDDDDSTTFRKRVGFTQLFEFANSSLSHLSSAATVVLYTRGPRVTQTIIILLCY